ncbi:hypothetical protein GGI35DRAFT_315316 [Trichoderma velutinum]
MDGYIPIQSSMRPPAHSVMKEHRYFHTIPGPPPGPPPVPPPSLLAVPPPGLPPSHHRHSSQTSLLRSKPPLSYLSDQFHHRDRVVDTPHQPHHTQNIESSVRRSRGIPTSDYPPSKYQVVPPQAPPQAPPVSCLPSNIITGPSMAVTSATTAQARGFIDVTTRPSSTSILHSNSHATKPTSFIQESTLTYTTQNQPPRTSINGYFDPDNLDLDHLKEMFLDEVTYIKEPKKAEGPGYFMNVERLEMPKLVALSILVINNVEKPHSNGAYESIRLKEAIDVKFHRNLWVGSELKEDIWTHQKENIYKFWDYRRFQYLGHSGHIVFRYLHGNAGIAEKYMRALKRLLGEALKIALDPYAALPRLHAWELKHPSVEKPLYREKHQKAKKPLQSPDKTGLGTLDKTGLGTLDKTGLGTLDKTGLGTLDKTGLVTLDKSGFVSVRNLPKNSEFLNGLRRLYANLGWELRIDGKIQRLFTEETKDARKDEGRCGNKTLLPTKNDSKRTCAPQERSDTRISEKKRIRSAEGDEAEQPNGKRSCLEETRFADPMSRGMSALNTGSELNDNSTLLNGTSCGGSLTPPQNQNQNQSTTGGVGDGEVPMGTSAFNWLPPDLSTNPEQSNDMNQELPKTHFRIENDEKDTTSTPSIGLASSFTDFNKAVSGKFGYGLDKSNAATFSSGAYNTAEAPPIARQHTANTALGPFGEQGYGSLKSQLQDATSMQETSVNHASGGHDDSRIFLGANHDYVPRRHYVPRRDFGPGPDFGLAPGFGPTEAFNPEGALTWNIRE